MFFCIQCQASQFKVKLDFRDMEMPTSPQFVGFFREMRLVMPYDVMWKKVALFLQTQKKWTKRQRKGSKHWTKSLVFTEACETKVSHGGLQKKPLAVCCLSSSIVKLPAFASHFSGQRPKFDSVDGTCQFKSSRFQNTKSLSNTRLGKVGTHSEFVVNRKQNRFVRHWQARHDNVKPH